MTDKDNKDNILSVYSPFSDRVGLPLHNIQYKMDNVLKHDKDRHTFIKLKLLPFKTFVIHKIGLQMFKYSHIMMHQAIVELFSCNEDFIITIQ